MIRINIKLDGAPWGDFQYQNTPRGQIDAQKKLEEIAALRQSTPFGKELLKEKRATYKYVYGGGKRLLRPPKGSNPFVGLLKVTITTDNEHIGN